MVITAGIARPYSRAIFEVALETGEFQQWSDLLAALQAVTEDKQIAAVIESPKLSREDIGKIIVEACETAVKLTDKTKNLINILTYYNRLGVVGEIKAYYEALRAEQEKTIDVKVTSAFEVSDAQQQALVGALKQKLEREITLECEIDETLLGGAILRAGDLVIDGSVTGKLKKLASQLSC